MDLDCSKDADADIAEDRESTTFTEIVSSLTECSFNRDLASFLRAERDRAGVA
jgi:hypothetical protein